MLILDTKIIALDTVELTLKNAHISKTAKPGQFLHVRVPNGTLRRPISIATINQAKNQIVIIFKVVGRGTEELANLKPGMQLNALGPNGSCFDLNVKENSTLLLIGGGVGVPPLHYLGTKLVEKNVKVISILGFQSKDYVFYEREFTQFGQSYIVTNDGSYGEKGYVTDLLNRIDPFDQYYTCGPLPMLQAVTKKLAYKPGHISLEEHMGCGIGACFACVIPTKEPGGYRKICQDGPVFPAQEVRI